MDDILRELHELGIEIDFFGGAAPLQIWGRIDGCWFYFRARHGAWEFAMASWAQSAEDAARITVKANGVGNFYISGTDDSGSTMEPEAGLVFVLRCAGAYRHLKGAE